MMNTTQSVTVMMGDSGSSIVVTATSIFVLDFLLIAIALYVSVRIARKLRRQKRYCRYVLESISQESIDTRAGKATKATNTATATAVTETRLVIPSQPDRPASPRKTSDPRPTSEQPKEDTRVPISSPLRMGTETSRSSFLSRLSSSRYEGEGRLVLHAGRTSPASEVLYCGDNWSYGENSIQHIPRVPDGGIETSTDSNFTSGTLPREKPQTKRVPLEISLYGTLSKSTSLGTISSTKSSASVPKEVSLGRRSGVARYKNRSREVESVSPPAQDRYIYTSVYNRAPSPRQLYATGALPTSPSITKREPGAEKGTNLYAQTPPGSTDTVRRAKPDEGRNAAPKLKRQENILLPKDYKVSHVGGSKIMMC